MTYQLPEPPAQVRVFPVSKLAVGGRWRVEAMKSLAEPLLLWFTRGQGRITMAGATRGYGAHNAIFIPPGTMHGFELSSMVFGTALFFGRSCAAVLPATPLHLRVRDTAPQMELNALIDAVQRETDGGRPGHDRAAACYLGLLGVWLERQAAQAGADAPPDAARRLAARYAELLERDFRTGKGVADYASALNVTPTHLTRVCRQTAGRSASAFLQDRLLFEARRLLSETRLPVKRVSETLGYTSPAYFSRVFQSRTGQTPSDFRRAT